jgi:hypothetical protein
MHACVHTYIRMHTSFCRSSITSTVTLPYKHAYIIRRYMYTYIHTCMHTYACIPRSAGLPSPRLLLCHTIMHTSYIDICIHTYMHACIHTHTHTSFCRSSITSTVTLPYNHAYIIHRYMYTYIHACIHTYARIPRSAGLPSPWLLLCHTIMHTSYIDICIHTYIHAYIHTHAYLVLQVLHHFNCYFAKHNLSRHLLLFVWAHCMYAYKACVCMYVCIYMCVCVCMYAITLNHPATFCSSYAPTACMRIRHVYVCVCVCVCVCKYTWSAWSLQEPSRICTRIYIYIYIYIYKYVYGICTCKKNTHTHIFTCQKHVWISYKNIKIQKKHVRRSYYTYIYIYIYIHVCICYM